MLGNEAKEQIMIFEWANLACSKYPELELLFAIPNGGYRKPIEAINLKKQGVKAGVPDMFLPIPKKNFAGLWIELKYGKNKASEKQKWWIERLNNQGYLAIVCYGFEETRTAIIQYLSL